MPSELDVELWSLTMATRTGPPRKRSAPATRTRATRVHNINGPCRWLGELAQWVAGGLPIDRAAEAGPSSPVAG